MLKNNNISINTLDTEDFDLFENKYDWLRNIDNFKINRSINKNTINVIEYEIFKKQIIVKMNVKKDDNVLWKQLQVFYVCVWQK